MKSQFTEENTEGYYNSHDATYRSFWDREGSLHWGIFDQTTGDDFLKASHNLNEIMASRAGIDGSSRVLDLGCGNGTTAMWLSESRGCQVLGVDLSAVRVNNAKRALESASADLLARVRFERASATRLPFEDNSFTHVWSQATIYHVHDKGAALREAYRVLAPGGLFMFDDLLKPRPDISDEAKTHVYDRLLFDTDFGFVSYQDALKASGFRVLEARDISEHLRRSYQYLARVTREKAAQNAEPFRDLSFAYEQMVKAQENGELGWGMYLCQK